MKLINQTHLNVVGINDCSLINKLCMRLNVTYKVVVIKHNKGTFANSNLRHVHIDDAIEYLKTSIQGKLVIEQMRALKELRELCIHYNNIIPSTSDTFSKDYSELPKYNGEFARMKRVSQRKERKKQFLKKWESVYGV